MSTKRDYALIYFITNQFASDKDRAKQEDALSNLAGIPVHILDRTWIVEKVYANNHLEMAIYALGIEGAQALTVRKHGPRDTARLAELEELDRQVADPSRYQWARYQLVEDCLRTAILARGLERSRHEVEARFGQADRLAQDYAYAQQRLRITYNRAWTAFWWYEDYYAFNRLYAEAAEHVRDSTNVGDLQLLQNLWQLLGSAVATGHISAQDAKLDERRRFLGFKAGAGRSGPTETE